jgi:hypothetical protein
MGAAVLGWDGEKATIAAVPIPVAASSSFDNGAPGSEEKLPMPPAQSLRQKEIGERTADVASIATARAAVLFEIEAVLGWGAWEDECTASPFCRLCIILVYTCA